VKADGVIVIERIDWRTALQGTLQKSSVDPAWNIFLRRQYGHWNDALSLAIVPS